VTYETVREWCQKFGSLYAALRRRKRARIGSKWQLDEVFIKMNGVQHYLWRGVDENGLVIDILVQPKRDRWAALRFFRKLLQVAPRSPRVIITDKVAELCCSQEAHLARYRTSAEPLSEQSGRELASTHPRTRKTNEALQIFGASTTLLSVFESINAPFRLRRHLLCATRHRQLHNHPFTVSYPEET
jgi:putative transposase